MSGVEDRLRVLTRSLDAAQGRLDKLDRYYDGRQGLAYGTERFRRAFDGRLSSLGSNFCRLVVDAVAERLAVVGFRLAGAEEADDNLWRIWQRNDLDEGSQLAHIEALVGGRCFLMVWSDETGRAQITVESPRQVIVAHDPGTRQRIAAAKLWRQDDEVLATLYLPEAIHRFAGRAADGMSPTVWERRGDVIANPLGVVPVVPLVNRQRLLDLDEGGSELDGVMPLQDALNRFLADLVVGAEFHCLPRRWATGMDIPSDPETGAPVEPFDQAVGRLWISESETTKFGQFPEADLSGLLAAIEMVVQHIGSISATPPHYLLQSKGGPASAESIKSSEASLVAKVKRRQLAFSGAWEEVMRLAFLVETGTIPEAAQRMETVWADPETRSLGQAADAALKKREVGVPWRQLMEDLGYSPTQVERMAAFRAADGLSLDALLRGTAHAA